MVTKLTAIAYTLRPEIKAWCDVIDRRISPVGFDYITLGCCCGTQRHRSIVIVIIVSRLVLPWRKHCLLAILIFEAQPQRDRGPSVPETTAPRPATSTLPSVGRHPDQHGTATVRVTAAKFTTHDDDHNVIPRTDRPTTRHPCSTASQPPHSCQTYTSNHERTSNTVLSER